MIGAIYVAGGIGYSFGVITTSYLCFHIHRSMCMRMVKHQNLQDESKELETRRETIDSGLFDETPPLAGPASSETDMLAVRPGALYLSQIASRNDPKVFDIGAVSTRIDHVRVETDQDISPSKGQ